MLKKNHIGVYGLIFRKNQILLVLKTRGPYKGKFDLPGGALHHGESIEDALKRELKEEIGVNINTDQLKLFEAISSVSKYRENQTEISFYHIGILFKVSDINEKEICFSIDDEDVRGAKWIDKSVNENELSCFASYVIKKSSYREMS